MKKIIATLAVAVVFTACDKQGSSSSSSASGDIDLKNLSSVEPGAQEAAYAYGVNLGNQLEQTANSPIFGEDSLSNATFAKGFREYFKGGDDKLSYLFGQSLARSVEEFKKNQKLGDDFDEEIVLQAMFNKYLKDSLLVKEDSVRAILNKFSTDNQTRLKNAGKKRSDEFFAKLKNDSKVTETESGLFYEVLTEGQGEQPADDSTVKIHYKGSNMDGDVFDETKEEPIERPINIFVPGFTEGLKLMKTGGKYKFYIPAELAYGENGNPRAGIPPNEVLTFEVELLEVKKTQAQAPAAAPQAQVPGK